MRAIVMRAAPFVIAVSLVTMPALPAQAQQASAVQQSDTRGFHFGIHYNAASLHWSGGPGAARAAVAGLGVRLGWGVTDAIVLHTQVDASRVRGALDDTYHLSHADLGARYNFGSAARTLRPYVDVAGTYRIATHEGDDPVRYAGPALTIGGGVQYFFRPSAAIELGARVSQGRYEHDGSGFVGGSGEMPASTDARTGRLALGISVYR